MEPSSSFDFREEYVTIVARMVCRRTHTVMEHGGAVSRAEEHEEEEA
jgi:hypothetical protein